MLTVGSRQSAREGKHWLGTARKAEVPILGRKYQEEDDLGAYFIHPRYYNGPTPEAWFLELDMHSCQGQPGTAPQPVQVEVSHQQYDAYAGETTATVYYSPADPNVFLLEDELRPLFGRQYRK